MNGLRENISRFGLLLVAAASLLALPGCGPKRMRADFIGFEKGYAETSNREVLLNLARLQNHDTTYFFKLGQISSSYRMNASVSTSGSYTIPTAGIGGNAIGGGSPGLTYENDPSFTFIPVNDDTSAQLLLKPVPAETFYNLYLQGWRVDQLFRLMVDRIELTYPNPTGPGCTVRTTLNRPPPPLTKSAGTQARAAYLRDAAGFATFLRVSALAYSLQQHGHLLLRGTTSFVPVDAGSKIPVPGGTPRGQDTSLTPKAADFAAAAAKGQSWRQGDDGTWQLGQQIFGAQFYLNPSPADMMAQNPKADPFAPILQDVMSDDGMDVLKSGVIAERSLQILASGFSIEGALAQGTTDVTCAGLHDEAGKPLNKASAHLVLRSLIGLMAAAAQEEDAFQALKAETEGLPSIEPGTEGQTSGSFSAIVPAIELEPALTLKWKSVSHGNALVSVDYQHNVFEIADASTPSTSQNRYWNRDMFRLINQLTAQVTVDISKFPLPGILRLNTN